MEAPEIVTLGGGDLVVELLPAIGGRMHRLRAFGRDLLRTPPDPGLHGEEGFFWGAYPMAPWCNRARTGPQRVAGRDVDLVANFPDGSAIHGLVTTTPWRVRGPGRLEIEVDDVGWPWPFGVRLEASVEGARLELGYGLTNRSDAAMPAGLGLHPWFVAPVEVALPATAVYRDNTGSAPEPQAADGAFDLRTLATPATGLDATWADLAAPTLELAWPETGVAARLSVATSAPSVLVALASPGDLGAVAIEPQTHGPDPLRRLANGEPDAPLLLPPGASMSLDLRLDVVLARNLR